MISNSNFKDFNGVDGSNLNSVHELISTYGMEAMPQAMEILFNEAMRLEREQHLGAGHYERNNERLDYANGYKPKRVKTRIGNLDLSIPQTRDSDFYPNCLEKGLRSERALSIALGEMYINGVSTRKVTNIVEAMCGFEVSAQMVSNASKELDASLEAWRNFNYKINRYTMDNLTIQEIANSTKYKPLIIHINPLGLFRMGRSNSERFFNLNTILNKVQKEGGNIAIPSYSYSYTKNDVYDIKHTRSDLDEISEYLRKNNKIKRTIDANFSYILFGNKFSNKHLLMSNYSSFGEGSLMEEVFNKDGYLGAIGGALEYLTEIHFLENKLNVIYRFDKVFTGTSIMSNGRVFNNKITYFCRDYSYMPSFVQLKKDVKDVGLVKTWQLTSFNLKIEVIKMQELYFFIKEKLETNPKYLLKSD